MSKLNLFLCDKWWDQYKEILLITMKSSKLSY